MKIIGIAGGSGAGKSTFTEKLAGAIGIHKTLVIQLDAFYKDNSHMVLPERKKLNFDCPEAFDYTLLLQCLNELLQFGKTTIPQYSYLSCTRLTKKTQVIASEFVLLEGILLFQDSRLLDLMDYKVYIELEKTERLRRIINRDTIERGKQKEEVVSQFNLSVSPMHTKFIEPTKHIADVIIDGKDIQGSVNKIKSILLDI